MYFVYKISNTVDDKLYIGITKNVEGRWYNHRSEANYYDNPLHAAMREYGAGKFHAEIIDEGSNREAMYIREQYWIQKLNTKWPNGYNARGKPIDERTCWMIENDMDRDRGYCVYTYANSLTGEIFSIRVDSVFSDLQKAHGNWLPQSRLTKTIISIWQQGGKVVIRRIYANLDTLDEASKQSDRFLARLNLKRSGSIVTKV